LKDGFTSKRRGKFGRLKEIAAGEIIQPDSRKKYIVLPLSTSMSSNEIRSALENPESSPYPIYEVGPSSGEFMYFVSRAALTMGVFYLLVGLVSAIALPLADKWYAVGIMGNVIPTAKTAKIKEVVHKFEVQREVEINQRTKDFFDAAKKVRDGK
jgi:hypothetical protein